MHKSKREDTETSDSSESSVSPEPQQPYKRKRTSAPFNFSIESLMQSSEQASQTSAQKPNNQTGASYGDSQSERLDKAGSPASRAANRLSQFECALDNKDIWHRFHPLDTEMIITKQGR